MTGTSKRLTPFVTGVFNLEIENSHPQLFASLRQCKNQTVIFLGPFDARGGFQKVIQTAIFLMHCLARLVY